MRNFALILFIVIPMMVIGQEYNNQHKNYIEVGFTGGSYSNSGANIGVFGAVGFFFESFGKQAALDVRAKELYITSPQREAGAITISYRLFTNKAFYFGGGFAHNHEVPFKDFLDEPIKAFFGNGKSIIHRSGAMIEAGYDFKSMFDKFGLYPVTNLSFTYLALDEEPNPYINLTVGFRIGMKRS